MAAKLSIKSANFFAFFLALTYFQHTFKSIIPLSGLDALFVVVDDAYVLLALLYIIFSILNKERDFIYRRTALDLPLLVLLLFFIISAVLNSIPIINFVFSIRDYFLPFILYFSFLYCVRVNEKTVYKLLGILYLIFIIQLSVQVLQVTIAIFNGTFDDDTATGTFSGANTLSYAYFFPLFHASYMLFIARNNKYFKRFIVYLSGMVTSFGMFAILVYPFLFVLYNLKKLFSLNRLKYILAFVLVFFLFLVSIEKLNPQRNTSTQQNFLWIFNPNYIVNFFLVSEFDVYSGSGRMLWFPVTYDRLQKYAFHPLVGMGPGMYASYAGFRTMAPPTQSIYNVFNQIELGFDTNVDSQIIPIWGELGFFGLILFLYLFIHISVIYYRYFRKSRKTLTKSLCLTASASSIYVLLGSYTNHILETQTIMVTFVLFLALAEKMYYLERQQYLDNQMDKSISN